MSESHGQFIWYELMTRNPDAAGSFYQDVVGWTMGEQGPGEIDYRMIAAGKEYVGGVFTLTDDMCEQGARPCWMGYVCVDDIEVSIGKLESLQGKLLMPVQDIPEVGRIAMVTDPFDCPLYIMQPAPMDGSSESFKPGANGHCAWNELATHHQDESIRFYGELFGWTNPESMDMGDMGQYKFLYHGDERIGAVSPIQGESPIPVWSYYFRVPNIDTTKDKILEKGGKVLHGPHEVPGGDFIIHCADPEGAAFALVGDR